MGKHKQYKTATELEEKIKEYFDSCWVDKVTEHTDKDGNCTMTTVRYQDRPYTVTGLALHLNLTRQGLINYQGQKEYVDTVTRAKSMVEMYAEESLFTSKNTNGPAFSLKNNFGWKDKQELAVEGSLTVKVVRYGGADGG